MARLSAAVAGVEKLVGRLVALVTVPGRRGPKLGGGVGGVYRTDSGKWRCRVMVNGRQVHGPSRTTKRQADADRELLRQRGSDEAMKP